MRNGTLRIAFLLIFIALGNKEINCQSLNSTNCSEKIDLFTDRTLYISGENIRFAAYLFQNENAKRDFIFDINKVDELEKQIKKLKETRNNFSNVIYVELITPSGEKVTGAKFSIDNSFSEGCIGIPKEVISGIYYIRAYTKFMRNNGNDSYNYITLKIVNPYKSEVISSYNNLSTSAIDSNKSVNPNLNSEITAISLDKNEYFTREPVKVQIDETTLKKASLRNFNLTVIPDFSINEFEKAKPQKNKPSDQFFYQEVNGISITGRLKESKTDSILPFIMVNLSILGDYKDIMASKTDSTGNFFFKLPMISGIRNIFLSTENLVDLKSTIQIDNDFCQSIVNIPTPAFQLTNQEKEVAYNLALNAQIASHFSKIILKDSIKNFDNPFYGEPNSKLILDKYIQLPTLEDYINELIPILKISKQNKRKYFKIFSYQSETNLYDPLVLLDMVAIDNPEKILSISPQKISRIDIINNSYVKGDYTYGGIISFFSKKGDFAGIDLPSSGVFLDFDFISDCSNCQISNVLTENKPDARNTLLWKPNVILNSADSKEVSFTTSDSPGKYIVLLRGITKDGKLFTSKKSFVVQAKK